jgi:hypothetical protein
MLKLELSSDGARTALRLIGRVQSAHLSEIAEQMGIGGPKVILDLEDVTIVDVDVVRFLCTCEREGTQLLNCPPYVREWISREGERT